MCNRPRKTLLTLITLATLTGAASFAADLTPRKITPKDKCPVCGMFVAKFPDFEAQIRFRDGTTAHFDGAKDMFTYCLGLGRYAPGRKTGDLAAIFVTDYYNLKLVDGRRACYVIGSDVYGPMGHELVPFATEQEARDFLKDHHGKKILRFHEVTPAVLEGLR